MKTQKSLVGTTSGVCRVELRTGIPTVAHSSLLLRGLYCSESTSTPYSIRSDKKPSIIIAQNREKCKGSKGVNSMQFGGEL